MYGGLSKLGIALTLVIAVSLLVGLFGQILYILCRRRRKLLSDVDAESSVVVLPLDYSTAARASSSRSSGNGFFSFWRNQSRIEPQEAHRRQEAPPTVTGTDPIELQELEDIIKWQALYGSSRLLFTIEEGEREGLDSETTYSSCAEKEVVKTTTTKVYLEERCHHRAVEDVAVTVVSIAADDDHLEAFTTPLETPCASPPYYTPAASPCRE